VTIDEVTGDLLIPVTGGNTLVECSTAWQEIDGQHGGGVAYLQADDVWASQLGITTRRTLVIDPTLIYSSFLGGSSGNIGANITADSAGNIYIAGTVDYPTASFNFPIMNAYQPRHGGADSFAPPDAFVTKLNPTGDRVLFSTFLGGGAHEVVQGMAVDASGNVYLMGVTRSTNFPTYNALYPTPREDVCFDILCSGDLFVTLSAAGTRSSTPHFWAVR
jgi:hypothetical protein